MILEALTSNITGNIMDTLMILAIFGPFAIFIYKEWEMWQELKDEKE